MLFVVCVVKSSGAVPVVVISAETVPGANSTPLVANNPPKISLASFRSFSFLFLILSSPSFEIIKKSAYHQRTARTRDRPQKNRGRVFQEPLRRLQDFGAPAPVPKIGRGAGGPRCPPQGNTARLAAMPASIGAWERQAFPVGKVSSLAHHPQMKRNARERQAIPLGKVSSLARDADFSACL